MRKAPLEEALPLLTKVKFAEILHDYMFKARKIPSGASRSLFCYHYNTSLATLMFLIETEQVRSHHAASWCIDSGSGSKKPDSDTNIVQSRKRRKCYDSIPMGKTEPRCMNPKRHCKNIAYAGPRETQEWKLHYCV